jgi:endonuclease/exonuclease/phosphatase family metal-dependent hydrolase
MKLVSLNIECNKHYERILPFLEKENPDVICLQEVLEEDFEFLKEKLGREGIYKPQLMVTSDHANYTDLQGKRFGVAIFSNHIVESGYSYYWGKESYSFTNFDEYIKNRGMFRSYVLIWVKVRNESGELFTFVTTHYPISKEGESSAHQLEVLVPFFEKLDTINDFILCGDFNAPRGNETFRRIAERYTDAIPEKYKTSLDQNLHRVKGLMFMVDCLFLTKEYSAHDVALVDGLSDHMAIVGRIEKVRLDNRR